MIDSTAQKGDGTQQKAADITAAQRPFIPDQPSEVFIKTAQEYVRAELELSNHIMLADSDLDLLKKLPSGAGIILAPNHADETDPRLCLELSRRTGKLFISMCNREAFDELFGLAGFVLQRLGHFSVERGAHDTRAKDHAVKVVAEGDRVMVIFPEGEIFYLNERVQPFHSGAVEIGMQALLEKHQQDTSFRAFIVPMAIKYHYPQKIDSLLDRRLTRMENRLLLPHLNAPMHERIHAIQKKLVEHEVESRHLQGIEEAAGDLQELIIATEKAIISEIQKRHQDLFTYQKRIIDETWQLEAELRAKLETLQDSKTHKEMQQDLEALQEVAHLASWRPQYYTETSSDDRLAEAVLKLEREIFRVRRPKQLATREVYIKFAEPIELSSFADQYQVDAAKVRHSLTEDLHSRIQSLIDEVVSALALER